MGPCATRFAFRSTRRRLNVPRPSGANASAVPASHASRHHVGQVEVCNSPRSGAAGFAAFDYGIPSLWAAMRPPAEPPESFELSDQTEAVLIARPRLEVEVRALDPAALAFLAACAESVSLVAAAAAALGADPAAILADTFAGLISAGAFVRLSEERP